MEMNDTPQDLAPNAWPVANFDEPMTPAEFDTLCDLESAGCFDAWCPASLSFT